MNPQQHRNFWAGGFLYDPAGPSVFLHKRDGNTPVNPHKWAFFGGQSEGNEAYLACFIRELEEEIGLRIEQHQAVHLREYMNTLANQYRVVFYVETDVSIDRLVLGEGAGFAWIKLSEVDQLDLADKTREDLGYFVRHRLTA